MTELKSLQQLFDSTKRTLKNQTDKEVLKGEQFNVFTILGLETKENVTHSAFLCELLKPNGSHLKGNIFLSLWLQTIGDNTIDIETANVQVEKFIGKVNILEKSGGRIDIYIWDNLGNSISIENKIYAYDQEIQIERYCNYHKKNKVYYLTLHGNTPSEGSRGLLKADTDFYIISYKEHILKWLCLCIKEAVDAPILRESIRQYIILIKKLTLTMDNTNEAELIDIVLSNFKEASYIFENFKKAQYALGEDIRELIIKKLKSNLPEKFIVSGGILTAKKFSQIWITTPEIDKELLCFGIESFTGEGNFSGHLFIGVFNNGGRKSEYALLRGQTEEGTWWINPFEFTDFKGFIPNISNHNTIVKLHTDKVFKEEFVNQIVGEIEQYLATEGELLLKYLLNKQSSTIVNLIA